MNFKEQFYQWIISYKHYEGGKDLSDIYSDYPNSKVGLKFLNKYTTDVVCTELGRMELNIYHLSIRVGRADSSFTKRIRKVIDETHIPEIEYEKFLMENI
jgi:hypothetical protein